MRRDFLLVFFVLAVSGCRANSLQQTPNPLEPRVHEYRVVEGKALRAYVFSPRPASDERAAAVLLFHGGGWSAGAPDWTFTAARRFADRGMVAVSIQYRLSEGEVTPIEALADICAAFRWAREQADDLGLDPARVAGYGVSAGGHLVAGASTVGCPSEISSTLRSDADALLLWSPALDVLRDGWFKEKLQGRAAVRRYSPAEHVRASTPPTSIVHGAADTLTPLSGAEKYCRRLKELGGVCELNVYDGVGHLLTRNLGYQEGDFDPDPKAVADGVAQHLRFLERLGFIAPP